MLTIDFGENPYFFCNNKSFHQFKLYIYGIDRKIR